MPNPPGDAGDGPWGPRSRPGPPSPRPPRGPRRWGRPVNACLEGTGRTPKWWTSQSPPPPPPSVPQERRGPRRSGACRAQPPAHRTPLGRAATGGGVHQGPHTLAPPPPSPRTEEPPNPPPHSVGGPAPPPPPRVRAVVDGGSKRGVAVDVLRGPLSLARPLQYPPPPPPGGVCPVVMALTGIAQATASPQKRPRPIPQRNDWGPGRPQSGDAMRASCRHRPSPQP